MLHIQDKAVLSTFVDFFHSFQLTPIKQPCLQYDPNATVFISNANQLFFNHIHIDRPTDHTKLMTELSTLQMELGIPLTVWMTTATRDTAFEQTLVQHCGPSAEFYGMVLDLNEANTTPKPANIIIERVGSEKQANEFAETYCKGFQFKDFEEYTIEWLTKQFKSEQPAAINYIAKIDGELAGVSSLTINRSFKEFMTGGFYNACVLPEFRKAGIGTAMACQRVNDAKEMKLDYLSIVLMSDAMARSYCERLGFKNVKTMTPYFIR